MPQGNEIITFTGNGPANQDVQLQQISIVDTVQQTITTTTSFYLQHTMLTDLQNQMTAYEAQHDACVVALNTACPICNTQLAKSFPVPQFPPAVA